MLVTNPVEEDRELDKEHRMPQDFGETNSHRWSLLTDEWLPSLMLDGTQQNLSLLGVFEKAPEIKTIQGDLDQQLIPILRVLEAFLERSMGGTTAGSEEFKGLWTEIWESGEFPMEAIQDYGARVQDRFYLLDERYPFFQVPGLEYMGDKDFDPIDAILADFPRESKFLFSQRAKGSVTSLDFASAARWLIFTQAYDTAGIHSPLVGSTTAKSGKQYAPKGAVGTGLLGAYGSVFCEGVNFFQTLLLNWVPSLEGKTISGIEGDLPVWERQAEITDVVTGRRPSGIADLLTWPSRRIRLIPDKAEERIVGYINGYGDIPIVVNSHALETMTVWRRSKEQAKRLGTPDVPAYMPKTHDPSRSLWRGFESLLGAAPRDSDTGAPAPGVVVWARKVNNVVNSRMSDHVLKAVSLHAQGVVYGAQSSVFDEAIDDVLDINVDLLRQDEEGVTAVLEVLKSTEKAVGSLAWFVQNLRIAEGSHNPQNDSGQVRETAYDVLDSIFRRRIAQFSSDKDRLSYVQEWKDDTHRALLSIADDYMEASSASPFVGGHEEDSPMTSAKALLWLRAALNKPDSLGPLGAGASDKDGNNEVSQ
jgi:CRISPR system Cascade subunit CasA